MTTDLIHQRGRRETGKGKEGGAEEGKGDEGKKLEKDNEFCKSCILFFRLLFCNN